MFPLSLRSFYSLMQGTSSPARLCRLAKELGYSGLALTDCDTLSGLWPFLAACRQQELQPLIGAEVTDPEGGRVLSVWSRTGSAMPIYVI